MSTKTATNRSLAQAYTHKISLKRDFMGYSKEYDQFCLFDDGDVLVYEATILFVEPDMAAMVRNWESLPEIFKAVKNDKYIPKES